MAPRPSTACTAAASPTALHHHQHPVRVLGQLPAHAQTSRASTSRTSSATHWSNDHPAWVETSEEAENGKVGCATIVDLRAGTNLKFLESVHPRLLQQRGQARREKRTERLSTAGGLPSRFHQTSWRSGAARGAASKGLELNQPDVRSSDLDERRRPLGRRAARILRCASGFGRVERPIVSSRLRRTQNPQNDTRFGTRSAGWGVTRCGTNSPRALTDRICRCTRPRNSSHPRPPARWTERGKTSSTASKSEPSAPMRDGAAVGGAADARRPGGRVCDFSAEVSGREGSRLPTGCSSPPRSATADKSPPPSMAHSTATYSEHVDRTPAASRAGLGSELGSLPWRPIRGSWRSTATSTSSCTTAAFLGAGHRQSL